MLVGRVCLSIGGPGRRNCRSLGDLGGFFRSHGNLARRRSRQSNDEQGGQYGQRACEQAPHPRAQTGTDEALHDYLAGQGASQGRALPRSQQGDCKEQAGQAAPNGNEQLVGLGQRLNHLSFFVEHDHRNDQNGGVDKKSSVQRQHRVEQIVLTRYALAGAGLGEGRVCTSAECK